MFKPMPVDKLCANCSSPLLGGSVDRKIICSRLSGTGSFCDQTCAVIAAIKLSIADLAERRKLRGAEDPCPPVT